MIITTHVMTKPKQVWFPFKYFNEVPTLTSYIHKREEKKIINSSKKHFLIDSTHKYNLFIFNIMPSVEFRDVMFGQHYLILKNAL